MTKKRSTPTLRVGQVWADNDPRSAGRTVQIIEVGLTKERHTGAAPWLQSRGKERREDQPAVRVRALSVARNASSSQIGRETVILASRFTPTRTGYRLVTDVEEA